MEENNVEQVEAVQEVTQPEVEAPTDVALPEPPQTYAHNAADVNIAKMREAKDRAEREKVELERKLAEYQKPQEPQEPQEEFTYADDDLIEGKHLKKEVDAVKKQLEAYKEQQRLASDEQRLNSRYTDFGKVVNEDTIQRLKESDPEFAEMIAYSQSSLYARGSSTYKRIKDLGLYVEDKHEADRAKAHENASKPKALNSVSPQQGDSPLSMANAFANGLTPELKRQLNKEMNDAAKKG